MCSSSSTAPRIQPSRTTATGNRGCPGFAATSNRSDRSVPACPVRHDRVRVAVVAGLAAVRGRVEPAARGRAPCALSRDRNDTSDHVNAAAAANVLRYQLIAAGQQYPGSKSLVYYFGSGAGGSRAPQGEFEPVRWFGGRRGGVRLRRSGRRAGLQPDRRAARPAIRRSQARPARRRGRARQRPCDSRATDAVSPSGVADRTELYWVFTLPGRGAAAVRAVREHPRFPPHAMGAEDVAL